MFSFFSGSRDSKTVYEWEKCCLIIEGMHFRFHPTLVTWYIIPGNISLWRGVRENGRMHWNALLHIIYRNVMSYHIIYRNFISAVNFWKIGRNTTHINPLSPQKICHCNDSGVSIILIDSFLVFEVITGHMTRSWVGIWSSLVLFTVNRETRQIYNIYNSRINVKI